MSSSRSTPACRASSSEACGEAAVELVDLGVDLDPVAGGQHERLGRVVAGEHVGEQLGDAVGGQRDPLEQVDRGAAVGQAHDQDAHVFTASGRARRGDLALLVEGEDLQLDGHVHLAHLDVVGHRQHAGREVEDAADPGRDQPVADLLGHRRRRRDHADRDPEVADDRFQLRPAASPAGRRSRCPRSPGRRRPAPGSRTRARRTRRSSPARARGGRAPTMTTGQSWVSPSSRETWKTR